MGQGKILWYKHRLMHRKRVTCELHDSYFRLMTINHAIPKIEWAIELLYNLVKTGSQLVGDQMSWWQDVVEKASIQQKTEPPGLRLSSPGEWERHNADGHNSGAQYVAVLFSLQLPLTHKHFTIKWEVDFFKEIFARFYWLRQYVSCMYMCIYVYVLCVCIVNHGHGFTTFQYFYSFFFKCIFSYTYLIQI